jgi:hypothetical protein
MILTVMHMVIIFLIPFQNSLKILEILKLNFSLDSCESFSANGLNTLCVAATGDDEVRGY